MQLIPDTANGFGVTDSLDLAQNIRGSIAYLDWLMGNFHHDPLMIIAACYAVEGAFTANNCVPSYAGRAIVCGRFWRRGRRRKGST